ncbi:MAG: DNA methyltransferase [Candidatus Aenigmatarchaeota archaeon]
MRLVDFDEYKEFIKKNNKIVLEGQEIILDEMEVKRFEPTEEELTDISTTVWSFPVRGSWATHKGDYRGNWPPQLVRAFLIRYTKVGDTVLDQMVGSGTTCIECKLLGRNCIAVDIEYDAVMLTLHRLYQLEKALERFKIFKMNKIGNIEVQKIFNSWIKVYQGDARNLSEIKDESIDASLFHPPYFSIIKYGKHVKGNLSCAKNVKEYLKMMDEVIKECFRVLKPGSYCGILVGDTRIKKHFVPLSHHILELFLKNGFILVEEVIKIQHKMKTTREIWEKKKVDFLLIYHEKFFIFRKPKSKSEYKDFEYSSYIEL